MSIFHSFSPLAQQKEDSTMNAPCDVSTASSSSCQSLTSTGDDSSLDSSSCHDEVDALGFPLDLLESDLYSILDEQVEDMMTMNTEDALMTSYQDLMSEAAMLSTGGTSSERRESVVAAMNYLTSTSMVEELPSATTDEKESLLLTMQQKLDECIRRTAESRAKLLQISQETDGGGLDLVTSTCQEDDTSKSSPSSFSRRNMVVLSSRPTTPVGPKKKTIRTKHPRRQSPSATTAKDGRRRRRPTKGGPSRWQKNSSNGAFACSGVLLNRIPPNCSSDTEEALGPTTLVGSSSPVVASKSSIHRILRQKRQLQADATKTACAGVGTATTPVISLTPFEADSNSITSFLRQSKKHIF